MSPDQSRGTALLARMEYLLALAICAALAVAHIGEIRWVPFIAVFVGIDLLGYLPGALAHRKAGGARISRVYYGLYNATHSAMAAAAILGVWWWASGPEWAMLAVPLHLCGDRALFGNFFKAPEAPFEPEAAR